MTIEKRKNSKGQVVYCVRRYGKGYPNGQFYRRVGVGDIGRRQAMKIDAELAAQELESKFTIVSRKSLSEALDALALEKRRHVKGSSWATYDYRIQRIASFMGDRLISDLGKSAMVDLQNHLLDEDRAHPKTINGYCTLLHEALNLAVDRGWIDANPCTGYKRMKEGDPTDAWRAYTDEELAALSKHLPDDWFGDILIVLANTGMRTGEVQKMEWDSIRDDRMIVRATASKSAATRIIPIPDPVALILDKNREKRTLVPFPGADGGIFPKTTLDKRWQTLRRKAGVEGRLHDFRHTYACRLASNGVHVHAAQRILGHQNIETTMVYYRLTDEEVLRFGRLPSPVIQKEGIEAC